MKKLLLIALPVLTATMLFGFRNTWHRVQVGVDELRGVVNESTASETLIAVAKKDYTEAQSRIRRADAALASYQREAATTSDQVARFEAVAKEGRSRLTTLRPALNGENGGVFVCGQNRYSPCEVKEEAGNLVTVVQRCEKEA